MASLRERLLGREATPSGGTATVTPIDSDAVSAPDAPRVLPVPRRVAGAVVDAVKSVGDQVSAAVQNPAGGVGKALARARSAAAGR